MQSFDQVPRDQFWDDIPCATARNVLQAFSDDDLRIIPTRTHSADSRPDKLRFLGKCLKKKMIQQEAMAAPLSFLNADPAGWHRVMFASLGVQRELGDLRGAEETLRYMIDRRLDKRDKSYHYSLATLLLERGKYAGAEKAALEVEEWLVGQRGRDSPQALGAKRLVILAVWKQGRSRHVEAEKLLKELRDIVSAMSSGQYATNQDEERESIKAVMAKMD
jgi:hypothetical protein